MSKQYHYISFWLGLFFFGVLVYELIKKSEINIGHLFLLVLIFFNLVISYLNAILDNQIKNSKQKGNYHV